MENSITIGVTGHRDVVENRQLKKKVKVYFKKLIAQNPKAEITLLSPLADGADRFVAKLFLAEQKKHKNLRLVVPMPFTQERYMEDFDEVSKKEFLELLDLADGSFQAPTFGDKSAYLGVGLYIIQAVDTLIAVWDGTDNEKVGGTAHIVLSIRGQCELVHIKCKRRGLFEQSKPKL